LFVSIHIPKTAGTSLSVILDYGSGRKIWYDYSELRLLQTDLQNAHQLQADKQQTLLAHKSFIENNFDFVHGHFYYAKYKDFFTDAKYITCVRKPIDRLVSHYYHLLDEADENYWLYQEIKSGNLDLADMAKISGIGDMQSQYLKGRDIKDYDFVFITEKLPDSVYHFQLLFNFERNDEFMNLPGAQSMPRSNIQGAKATERAIILPSVIEKAQQELRADNELYQKALEKFIIQGGQAQDIISTRSGNSNEF
tara:strand:+ start:187 stop:942 length:756 start_codon:yes stop_codon:yes gene_type:complete